MPVFGCPYCDSGDIEEKDVYVRVFYRPVLEWAEDGSPVVLGEGAWGDVEHLEEDLEVELGAVERDGRFICTRCDRSFDVPKRQDSRAERQVEAG